MIRKFLTVAGTAALAVFVVPSTASADELTAMTASASPGIAAPGDVASVTVTVTNNHDRKITYVPISAPEMFAECAVDIGTLVPGATATVECDGIMPERGDLEASDGGAAITQVFSIHNAESEHNVTYAEAQVDVEYEPESPPTTPAPEDKPKLPVTGVPIGTIALAGTGAIAAGVITLRVVRRRGHPAQD